MIKITKTISILASTFALWLCGCSVNHEAQKVAINAYKDFLPAKLLLDNNSRLVNAHGAGFLFANGKYWMFGEHKLSGRIGNKSLVGVHCYSSKDLYNWRDEGIALEMSRNPDSEIIVGTIVERPKVVFDKKTRKYVMWAHMENRKGATAKSTNPADIATEKPDYSSAKCFVAVADNLKGPYKFVRSFRPNAKKYPLGEEAKLKAAMAKLLSKNPTMKDVNGQSVKRGIYPVDYLFLRDFDKGQMARDMTVFVDDDPDATAYLICAAEDNFTIHIHELTSDYQNFTGRFKRIFPGKLHEAPALFKHRGKYYMFTSHCTGWKPNEGRSSVADSILGQWRELGNPFRGNGELETKFNMAAKPDTSFRSQSTFVIPVNGKPDAFVYVGDRWNPADAMDGRYIFLPIEWEADKPIVRWRNSWDLSFFDKKQSKP